MTDYATNAKERIAREHYHDCQYIGLDAEGDGHYWSMYHQAVVVVDCDGSTESWELADTPLNSLTDWMEHVRQKRGWEHTCVSGSLIRDIRDAVPC